jgi:hypothetical protein
LIGIAGVHIGQVGVSMHGYSKMTFENGDKAYCFPIFGSSSEQPTGVSMMQRRAIKLRGAWMKLRKCDGIRSTILCIFHHLDSE